MRCTPPLPSRITDFELPGYTNAHQLCPNTKELYVTERLREHFGVEAGDWDSPVLILAKDAAPTELIEARIARGESAVWRPSSKQMGDRGGVKTNKAIAARVVALRRNVLYGSALANLMSDKAGMSRSLDGFYKPPLQPHLQYVLRWVIDRMPNLRVIACLGAEAWFVTTHVLGHRQSAKNCATFRDEERTLTGRVGTRQISATAHYHPAARGSTNKDLGWRVAADHLADDDRLAT